MLCNPITNSSDTGNPLVLAESQLEKGILVLHLVRVDKDLPVIMDLFKRELGQSASIDMIYAGMQEMLASFAGSKSSQAFMVRLGETPLFEIEVHEARKHYGFRKDFEPEEGDFFISLLAGNFDQAEFVEYIRGLQLCLDYFFRFPEVRRIIAAVYPGYNEKQLTNLFTQAGLDLFLPKSILSDPALFSISSLAKDYH